MQDDTLTVGASPISLKHYLCLGKDDGEGGGGAGFLFHILHYHASSSTFYTLPNDFCMRVCTCFRGK